MFQLLKVETKNVIYRILSLKNGNILALKGQILDLSKPPLLYMQYRKLSYKPQVKKVLSYGRAIIAVRFKINSEN